MTEAACHGYANGCSCDRCARRFKRHNTATIHNKDVRQFVDAQLTPHGWRRVDEDSHGHPQFWHPDVPVDCVLTVPQSPSDRRWQRNVLAEARRIWPDMPRERGKYRKREHGRVTDIREAWRPKLIEYADCIGVGLTDEAADALLDSEGSLSSARTFLNRAVAAKRRALKHGQAERRLEAA